MILPPPFTNALILTGPTASGKTALSLELAERMNAEIVVMDSMTVYRGMDIGTAKPTSAERVRVPHHLLDTLDPWESANVAWWLREAGRCCVEIERRGKQPLIVGGTPFYLKALIKGLFEGPPVDVQLRQRLEKDAETLGSRSLHERLASIDPASAARLHPNDVRRVVRALEVWHLTGKPLSAWQKQNWFQVPSSEFRVPSSEFRVPSPKLEPGNRKSESCLILDVPREELYERINRRVEAMISAGWLDEVRRLRELPRRWSKEASQALGYRELAAFLDGQGTLAEAISLIQMRTRQFAKRQLTWFRHLPGCQFCEGKLTFDLWRWKMS